MNNKCINELAAECLNFNNAESVANAFRKELSSCFPNAITISAENYNDFSSNVNGYNNKTIIFVTTYVDFSLYCGKIPVRSISNGEEQYIGLDYNFMPSRTCPVVIITSDNDEEIISIALDICSRYKEGKAISVPINNNTYMLDFAIQFSEVDKESLKEKIVTLKDDDGNKIKKIYLNGLYNIWGIQIDSIFNIKEFPKKNEELASLGKLITPRIHFRNNVPEGSNRTYGRGDDALKSREYVLEQLNLKIKPWDKLFIPSKKGFFNSVKEFFGDSNFNELKHITDRGEVATPQVFMNTFGWVWFFYADLYDAYKTHKPLAQFHQFIIEGYEGWMKIYNDLCSYLELTVIPNKNYSTLDPNMNSFDFFNFMHENMQLDNDLTLVDVKELYVDAVEQSNQRGYEKYLQNEEERRMERAERRESGAGSGSFLQDVASTAIGSSIANHGIKKELRKQTKMMEEQRDEAKRQKIRDEVQRSQEKSRHNYEVDQIMKQNRERRRKGLPELPVPPKWY